MPHITIAHTSPPDSDNPPDVDETEFLESARAGMLYQQGQWRRNGQVFSWIDEEPRWVSASDWGTSILPEPEKPCLRRFRLSLIGGGQIRVTEKFEICGFTSDFLFRTEPKLRVQAQTKRGLKTYNATVSNGAMLEMATYAVVFPARTPQAIANRTAATLRLIGAKAENFAALLARSERCGCCDRPLKDEVSKLLGIGPDCAQAMRLPHTMDVANRILARRRELLGVSN